MTPLGYSKYSLIRHLTLGWISTQITTWEPLGGGGSLGALVWLGCLSLTSRATLDALRFKAGCSRADPGDSPLFSLCFLLPTPCSDISDTSHAEKPQTAPNSCREGCAAGWWDPVRGGSDTGSRGECWNRWNGGRNWNQAENPWDGMSPPKSTRKECP